MMEVISIRSLQLIGSLLIVYSIYTMAVNEVLLAAAGLEYGIILVGIAGILTTIRNRRINK
jgi:hypothetical protein